MLREETKWHLIFSTVFIRALIDLVMIPSDALLGIL